MRFVILKTSSLGDILHTFPIVSYLKKRFPSCKVDWVVEKRCSSLLKAHPQIDRVIEVDTHYWRKHLMSKKTYNSVVFYRKKVQMRNYDVAFDLQGNLKSALLLSFVRAKNKVGFGSKGVSEWPNILFTTIRFDPPFGKNIREDYLSVVKRYFKDNTPCTFPTVILWANQDELPKVSPRTALICPGAAWSNKRIPILSWVEFLATRAEKHFLFAWGTLEEKAFCQEIAAHFGNKSEVLKKLTLPLLQNLMAKVDIVIALDSLALHLCATTKTPTISFFGPSNPQKYAPPGKEHSFFWGHCPYNVRFEKRCPHLRSCRTGACIKTSRRRTRFLP